MLTYNQHGDSYQVVMHRIENGSELDWNGVVRVVGDVVFNTHLLAVFSIQVLCAFWKEIYMERFVGSDRIEGAISAMVTTGSLVTEEQLARE